MLIHDFHGSFFFFIYSRYRYTLFLGSAGRAGRPPVPADRRRGRLRNQHQRLQIFSHTARRIFLRNGRSLPVARFRAALAGGNDRRRHPDSRINIVNKL